jgi:hypothetical protein
MVRSGAGLVKHFFVPHRTDTRSGQNENLSPITT